MLNTSRSAHCEVNTRSVRSTTRFDHWQRYSSDELWIRAPPLAQDLDPVADSPHQPASVGKLADLLHHRRKPRDRARAQVVAVGKSTRKDDAVAALQVRVLVPQVLELGSEHLVDHPSAVAVRPRAGENDDSKPHLRL